MSDSDDACLFVDRPSECVVCLRTRWLKCLSSLSNKRHLLVRPEVRLVLHGLLDGLIDSEERYKVVSGEPGRKLRVLKTQMNRGKS